MCSIMGIMDRFKKRRLAISVEGELRLTDRAIDYLIENKIPDEFEKSNDGIHKYTGWINPELRSDERLLSVLNELRFHAARNCKIVIIEIPRSIDWEVQVHENGREYVTERQKRWGEIDAVLVFESPGDSMRDILDDYYSYNHPDIPDVVKKNIYKKMVKNAEKIRKNFIENDIKTELKHIYEDLKNDDRTKEDADRILEELELLFGIER